MTMECHATGQTPSRTYPRANFVSLFTPLGILRFRDELTMRGWIEGLPPESQAIIRGHEPAKTPGVMIVGTPKVQP